MEPQVPEQEFTQSTAMRTAIAGVTVDFPARMYPSQVAMMNMVIQALKKRQNALLESPTGSGKSLALLCSSLAWQRMESERAKKHNDDIDARILQLALQVNSKINCCNNDANSTTGVSTPQKTSPLTESSKVSINTPECAVQNLNKTFDNSVCSTRTEEDDDDDFQPFKRLKYSQKVNESQAITFSPQKVSTQMHLESPSATLPLLSQPANNLPFVPPEKKLKVPRIFFATRTHKQIAQITRELRKTLYQNTRSVVLASREHTCINPLVANSSNKNEKCKELLDSMGLVGGGCGWHINAKKLGNFEFLSSYGIRTGFDLEDYVATGKQVKACPYYGARYLMEQADIIFCPYNYLIDPRIRKSLGIDLTDEIVIFDEAHNMEDASREAASFTTNVNEFKDAMQDCEKVAAYGVLPDEHTEVVNMLSIICSWIMKEEVNFKTLDFTSLGKHYTGTELLASLMCAGITPDTVRSVNNVFGEIMAQREQQQEMNKDKPTAQRGRKIAEKPSITPLTILAIERFLTMIDVLQRNNGQFRDDFRFALVKSTVTERRETNRGFKSKAGDFKNSIVVNFWCLNPAVAFADIKSVAHSVVVTSGTLSPMNSFESELGCPFSIKLEAPHVIDKNRIWASTIGIGPSNVNLNGSYNNVQTLNYQDELGDVILRVCQEVPYGVLCFLPSYRLLDTIINRLQATRAIDKITKLKTVFVEPRTGNVDFQLTISDYYRAIEECKPFSDPNGPTGAIFFAVCRGKVSEGLDFADNNARAVICIGIPFPAFHDFQVKLKMDYNEKNSKRGVLSGSAWYETQAFRALNQALGRCIRHRNDWGAILLVDDRFLVSPRYVGNLSKWIRTSIANHRTFEPMISSLRTYVNSMIGKLEDEDFMDYAPTQSAQ